MSKVIDTLKMHSKSQRDAADFTQDELARTFFSASTKSAREKRKSRKAPIAPWIIAGCAFALALFVIIFNTRLDIKVNITKQNPLVAQKISQIRLSYTPKGQSTSLVRDGKSDTHLIKSVSFLGDAHKFSREDRNAFTLINSKGAGWAIIEINFKKPIDMRKFDISYVAKGQVGNEQLILVIVDANKKLCRMERDSLSVLTKEWQAYTISLKPLRNKIDLASVSTIQFEFGSLTTGNSPTATIFLKDVNMAQAKGM